MSSQKFVPSLNYRADEQVNGRYQFVKIRPLSNSDTVTVGSSYGELLEFELPRTIYNLGRTYLSWTWKPDAPGTGTRWNVLRVDFPVPIDRVELITRSGGVRVVDVKQVQLALNQITRFETPYTKMKTRQALELVSDVSRRFNVGAPTGSSTSILPNLNNQNDDYTQSMRYLAVGGDNTATPELNMKVPLSAFIGTLLEKDQDITLLDVATLRFTFGSNTSMGMISANATNFQSVGSTALNTNQVFSNIRLNLAVESNLEVAQSVQQQAMTSGLRIVHRAFRCDRQLINTGTSQSSSYSILPTDGGRLVRAYHSLYNSTQSSNTLYAHLASYNGGASWNAGTVRIYYDGSPLQDQLNALQMYDELNDKFEDSCIVNWKTYENNFAVIADFTGSKLVDTYYNPNSKVGVPINDQSHLLTFEYENSAATSFLHVATLIFQKELVVSPAGVQIVAA